MYTRTHDVDMSGQRQLIPGERMCTRVLCHAGCRLYGTAHTVLCACRHRPLALFDSLCSQQLYLAALSQMAPGHSAQSVSGPGAPTCCMRSPAVHPVPPLYVSKCINARTVCPCSWIAAIHAACDFQPMQLCCAHTAGGLACLLAFLYVELPHALANI